MLNINLLLFFIYLTISKQKINVYLETTAILTMHICVLCLKMHIYFDAVVNAFFFDINNKIEICSYEIKLEIGLEKWIP